MLVLTRKLGEVVCIGHDVELFVMGVSRGKVKLGFRAPREVVIQRAEVVSHVDIETRQTDDSSPHPVLALSNRDDSKPLPPLRLLRRARGA